jgi:hypothetical protein
MRIKVLGLMVLGLMVCGLAARADEPSPAKSAARCTKAKGPAACGKCRQHKTPTAARGGARRAAAGCGPEAACSMKSQAGSRPPRADGPRVATQDGGAAAKTATK